MNSPLLNMLAMFLVVNSHLDSVYPIETLATGGSIGNSIFFALSGYGLAMSFKKARATFVTWYIRRVKRIYPTVVVVIGVACLIGLEQVNGLFSLLQVLIWPTSFWFIEAILLFYILFYGVERFLGLDKSIYMLLFLFVPYFIFYYSFVDLTYFSIEAPGHFKWLFYFQIMLLGAYIASKDVEVICRKKYKWLLLILTVFVYFGIKIMLKMTGHMEYQFAVHLSTFPLIFFIFVSIGSVKLKNGLVSRFVGLFGEVAFEVYLIHVYILHSNILNKLEFPVNLIVFLFMAFSLAILTSKVLASIASIYEKRLVVSHE